MSGHKQAARVERDKMVKMLDKRAVERKTMIDQARGRQSTYPLWAGRMRARAFRSIGLAAAAFGFACMMLGAGALATILSIGGGLGFAALMHRSAKDKEHAILLARPSTIENRIDRTQHDVEAFQKSVQGLQIQLTELEADSENRPMPEADWQKHAYGPDSMYFETATVIQRIDAELQRLENGRRSAEQQAERDRKRAIVEAWEKKAAEDRATKWNALPFEIQAMGCETCQSMSHPANVCMAGDDVEVTSYDDFVREGKALMSGLEGRSPRT